MDLSRLIDALKKRASGAIDAGRKYINDNPSPTIALAKSAANYVAPKAQKFANNFGNYVEETIRPPVSPIPQKITLSNAIRNVGGIYAGEAIKSIPSAVGGTLRLSPPGQFAQGLDRAYKKDLTPIPATRQLSDANKALTGVGYTLKAPATVLGGGINVAINALKNKFLEKRPAFEGSEEAFRSGMKSAAPVAPVSSVNPLFRNTLGRDYGSSVAGGTIPLRATMAAFREGIEGAGTGFMREPVEGESRVGNAANDALMSFILGGVGQGAADFGSLSKAKILPAIREIFKGDNNKRLEGKFTMDNGRVVPMSKYASTIDIGDTKNLSKEKTLQLSKPLQENPQAQGANGSTMRQNLETPTSEPSIPQDVSDYIAELTGKQKQARNAGSVKTTLAQKGKSFLAEVKKKFVDDKAPLEDILTEAEKRAGFEVRPSKDIRLQIDRTIRNKSIAAQFAEDNGLGKVIQEAPDLDALDQYMIAKQAQTVAGKGKETGRDLVKDQKLIQSLGPQYEELAKQVTNYSKKLKQYMVESGLISKELSDQLDIEYPDYVPLNRIFSESELEGKPRIGGKQVASLAKQTVVQKLQGSTREIQSPIESLLQKTNDAFNQGERNKTAKILASYKDLPGFEGLLRELKDGETAKHTISFLDNGVKRIFETTQEIEAVAKSLNQEQMGLIAKIFNVPTRVLQLGATGLNVPFVLTNFLKDQITTYINSNNAAKTSIMNPQVFLQSVFSALKQDDLYKEVVRNGGMQTSFDISRTQPNLTASKIRAGKSLGSKIKYNVTNPSELLRSLENIVGRSESIGRIQNYKGTKDALLQQGRTMEDAVALAAKAARNTTANFPRHGEWSRQINWIVPFFNAGIQGSRSFVNAAKNDPKGTGAKLAVGVFMPTLAATAWNLLDEKRKVAYDDIPDYEKETNIIIIPPDPQRDDNGKWNVIKIPLPPGLSNLATVVRRGFETTQGLDPIRFTEIAGNLITSGTSIDVTKPTGIGSTFVPQGVKPLVESGINKNLYTGRDIVPQYMKDLAPEQQAYKDTSGTARGIGKVLNTSPLKVENAVKTSLGGLGSQLLNAGDTIGNKLGIVPDEQVGGESIGGNLRRRFLQSSGGDIERTIDQEADSVHGKVKSIVAGSKVDISSLPPRTVADSMYRILTDSKKTKEEKMLAYGKIQQYITPEIKKELVAVAQFSKLGFSAEDRKIALIPEEIRARAIYERLGSLTSKNSKIEKIKLFQASGLITPTVAEEIKRLAKEKK